MIINMLPSIFLGSVRQWHWISSALCLVGMFLFAFTGITLNHADTIGGTPEITTLELPLPTELVDALRRQANAPEQPADDRLPTDLRHWLNTQGINTGGRQAEWSSDEIYMSMPRPGGDAWMAIDLTAGELLFEATDRGVISYLNDLHKGRNTGVAWKWFLDIFSVSCLIFCFTGLWLLQRHSHSRPSTWPLTALGLVIPVLIAILFVHR